ncbi:MAG: cyclic nucleotide-binding domain-containing protein [Candidatus Omnitrophica bacterium]|nr:cyclic nucleotide-binding domain-containing protein [Candidatus Omnitrophota bacterium]MBI2174126.1 cyclic nucleotide-binding domain-containing protein [Candidatus Omnitrophota bacterium]MBI3010440.1 cyclic nucleotide-binding domain-containing protein [Candidatus Omnitrophota bacterium]
MTTGDARSQDKVVILKRLLVFSVCTEEQLQFIAERTRLVEYKKGEIIYREGDPADAFYIVSFGRLRVFSKAEADTKERTLSILHNGDCFGEISLLTGESHSASVHALNDTLILRLEKKDFEDVINRIPSLVLHLSRSLSKRLRVRELGSEFSDTTIIGITSAIAGIGRTSFSISLATHLVRETAKAVAVVDFAGTSSLYQVPGQVLPQASDFSEKSADEIADSAIAQHPLGFQVLSAAGLIPAEFGERMVAPLLSVLANRFHYIILDLPIGIELAILKALVQSDLIFLLTDAEASHVIQTTALVHQLAAVMGSVEQRIRLVMNQPQPTEAIIDTVELSKQVGLSVVCSLPYIHFPLEQWDIVTLRQVLDNPFSSYTVAVRHIARELGGLLVGLALGSGAALGLAHIGVLKVIEREGIPIDIIAGSSIGALVGGLWASGRSAQELEEMALRMRNPWDIRKLFVLDVGTPVFSSVVGVILGILVGWLAGFWAGFLFGFIIAVTFGLILGPLVGGPIRGSKLMAQLEQDFGGKTFQDTRIPLKVVAANPVLREEVVFDSGSIADAVRASVSIPGIFKPVIRQGKICLDGGVVSPIPIGVLKRYGAHHVIAVNVFPSAAELSQHQQQQLQRRLERDAQLAQRSLWVRLLWRVRQEIRRSLSPLVFDVIMRSMQSMEHLIAEVACREADLTLRPTVAGSHWLEFFHPEKFIRRGEEVALQALPELKRIAGARRVDNNPQ